MEAYDSVRVALRGEQGQRNATVRSLDEWNAFPDEDRDDISLFHNVTNSVGDRGLEHHTLGLQASKVHTHELARLEHHSCTKILPLREVKCKPFPMGATGYPAIGP